MWLGSIQLYLEFGANTFAEISLIDRTTAASGNDFALDDISLQQPQPAYLLKMVISVSPPSVTGFSLYNAGLRQC